MTKKGERMDGRKKITKNVRWASEIQKPTIIREEGPCPQSTPYGHQDEGMAL
jgi:hypothetical protein